MAFLICKLIRTNLIQGLGQFYSYDLQLCGKKQKVHRYLLYFLTSAENHGEAKLIFILKVFSSKFHLTFIV